MHQPHGIRISLNDIVLDWHEGSAVIRRKTFNERKWPALAVLLVGTALFSVALFMSPWWFVALEMILCGGVIGGLLYQPGKEVARFTGLFCTYAGQEQGPIVALWQKEWRGDSYRIELGFVDHADRYICVLFADAGTLTAWLGWREIAEGLGVPLQILPT